MKNVISTALTVCQQRFNADSNTFWSVTFVTGEQKRGVLTALEDGHYYMQCGQHMYFFHADQVSHLSPHLIAQRRPTK